MHSYAWAAAPTHPLLLSAFGSGERLLQLHVNGPVDDPQITTLHIQHQARMWVTTSDDDPCPTYVVVADYYAALSSVMLVREEVLQPDGTCAPEPFVRLVVGGASLYLTDAEARTVSRAYSISLSEVR